MGKSCIRFREVEDLALDVIGKTIKELPAKRFIDQYQAALLQLKTSAASKVQKRK